MDPAELTPVITQYVQRRAPIIGSTTGETYVKDILILVKNDQAFEVAEVNGGKARAVWALAHRYNPLRALCTATGRASAQMQIVAAIGRKLGLPVRCHTAKGPYTPEMEYARACGAEIIQHQAGYTSVLVERATKDANRLGLNYIPYGLAATAARVVTTAQVQNLPKGKFKRLVIPLGGGVSASGVLWGMVEYGLRDVPVLGVRVGGAPEPVLNKMAPPFWREMMTIVQSPIPYHHAVKHSLTDIRLDPHYEAKCYDYLQGGDLFWVVGHRVDKAGPGE